MQKKKTKKTRKKKKKVLSGKRLTNKLDQMIRDIFKVIYPNPVCFVCGQNKGWFHPKTNVCGCQVGHYVSRKYFFLRWDLDNVKPQCSVCNRFHNYNGIPYTLAIIKHHGIKRLFKLNQILKETKGVSMSDTKKRTILAQLRLSLG